MSLLSTFCLPVDPVAETAEAEGEDRIHVVEVVEVLRVHGEARARQDRTRVEQQVQEVVEAAPDLRVVSLPLIVDPAQAERLKARMVDIPPGREDPMATAIQRDPLMSANRTMGTTVKRSG